MSILLSLLARGAATGGAAGLFGGALSCLLTAPAAGRAASAETAAGARQNGAGATAEHHAEAVSPSAQYLGAVVGTTVTGLVLGLLFAVVYAQLHRRDPDRCPLQRALVLAAAGFTAVGLLPFLWHPADPQGIGGPVTAGLQVGTWLTAVAVGLVTLALAQRLHRMTADFGHRAVARWSAAAGVLVLGLGALSALPGSPGAAGGPVSSPWVLAVLSPITAAVLWAGLGIGFGALELRAVRARTVPAEAGVPAAC